MCDPKILKWKSINLKIFICLYNSDRYCVKKLGRSAVNKAPNGAVNALHKQTSLRGAAPCADKRCGILTSISRPPTHESVGAER